MNKSAWFGQHTIGAMGFATLGGALLIVAFAFRLWLSTAYPNVFRADEIFQNLEPAYRMWTGAGVQTWEWREGVRSALFPGFLSLLMRMSSTPGNGDLTYLNVIAGALTLVSMSVPIAALWVGYVKAGRAGALICGVLCALWPDLVYFGPKPLIEIQGGHALIVAAAVAQVRIYRREIDDRFSSWSPVAIGFFCALAFALRIQLAPAAALIALWSCRFNMRAWVAFAIGACIPVLALGVTDWVTWGAPFASVIRNVQFNLLKGVSQEFGTQPIWWFPAIYISLWGAAALILGIGFVAGLTSAPLLASVAAMVIVSHSFVAHKEYTFIFAAIPPFLIVSALGLLALVRRLSPADSKLGRIGALALSAAFCAALSLTTFLSLGFRPMLKSNAEFFTFGKWLAKQDDLCGLGVYANDFWWSLTNGNVGMNRTAPFYSVPPDRYDEIAPAVNYMIIPRRDVSRIPGAETLVCGGESAVCVVRTKATCTPDPRLELNADPKLGLPNH